MFTHCELFAGCGGLALGFEKAGFKTVGLLEKDKNACATISNNRPEWNIWQTDIRDFSGENIKCDVLTAGFPCQPFSVMGQKKGLEDPDRGDLIFEVFRLAREIKPKIILLENVKGLYTRDKGEILKYILSCSPFGYHWCKILDASYYKVPQKRERLFIVGSNIPVPFDFPNPVTAEPMLLKEGLKNVAHSPGATYNGKTEQMFKKIPPGGNYKCLSLDIQKQLLGRSFGKGGSTGVLRRLAWDKPCPTLLTSPCQNFSQRCHPDYERPLTTREYARIQTFPDNWVFKGSLTSIYRQIGNAVPVNLAYYLAQSCKQYLEKYD